MANRINVRAVLEQYGERAKQAAQAALRENAETVVNEAKRRCPVDTGKLRDSIRAVQKNENTMRVVADAKNKGFPYGRAVENRTPFLFPALAAKRNEIKQNVIGKIRDSLRRG